MTATTLYHGDHCELSSRKNVRDEGWVANAASSKNNPNFLGPINSLVPDAPIITHPYLVKLTVTSEGSVDFASLRAELHTFVTEIELIKIPSREEWERLQVQKFLGRVVVQTLEVEPISAPGRLRSRSEHCIPNLRSGFVFDAKLVEFELTPF